MKHYSRYLILGIWLFVFTGCISNQKKTNVPYTLELSEHRFPGIFLEIDNRLNESIEIGQELNFRFTLTNRRPEPIVIESARLRLVTTQLSEQSSTITRSSKINATIAPKDTLNLSQYFYFGPKSKADNNGMIYQWLGELSGEIQAGSNSVGDRLIGIVLALKIDGVPNYDIFISKHHYDASKGYLIPYFLIRGPSAPVQEPQKIILVP